MFWVVPHDPLGNGVWADKKEKVGVCILWVLEIYFLFPEPQLEDFPWSAPSVCPGGHSHVAPADFWGVGKLITS